MRVVFMGTPDFAVPTLTALIASSHEVVLVISKPDRPVGRRQEMT
jgi:methionyl-tRNA formyltransferase